MDLAFHFFAGTLVLIFEAIQNLHHYRDQDQLVKFVADDLGGLVSEEKLQLLSASLKISF